MWTATVRVCILRAPMRSVREFLHRTYGGLPTTTWLLCGAAFVNRAGSMVLPFLGIYLGARFGYTIEESGYVLALYGLGSTLGNLLGGRLVDPLGGVRLQITTLIAAAVWMQLLTIVGSAHLIAAGVFVLGMLNDAFRPGNMSAVLSSVPPELGPTAMTLNRVAINAGWAIGPTIGGQLAGIDYRLLFVADGATCAMAAVILFAFVPRRLPHEHHGAKPTASERAALSPWRDRQFLLLLGTTMLTFLAFMQYFSTETRHLKNVFGLDDSDIGWLLAINPTLIVLIEMPIVRRIRTGSQLRFVALGTLLIAASFPLLAPRSLGMNGVIMQLLLLTMGEIMSFSPLSGFVGAHAPPAARGAYLGVYGATFSAAFVVAPALGGRVYDRFGADALWYGCAVAGTIAAACYWWLHRVVRRAAN